MIVLIVASAALWTRRLDGTNWVYAMLVVLGGHNAQDIVSAMKGQK